MWNITWETVYQPTREVWGYSWVRFNFACCTLSLSRRLDGFSALSHSLACLHPLSLTLSLIMFSFQTTTCLIDFDDSYFPNLYPLICFLRASMGLEPSTIRLLTQTLTANTKCVSQTDRLHVVYIFTRLGRSEQIERGAMISKLIECKAPLFHVYTLSDIVGVNSSRGSKTY